MSEMFHQKECFKKHQCLFFISLRVCFMTLLTTVITSHFVSRHTTKKAKRRNVDLNSKNYMDKYIQWIFIDWTVVFYCIPFAHVLSKVFIEYQNIPTQFIKQNQSKDRKNPMWIAKKNLSNDQNIWTWVATKILILVKIKIFGRNLRQILHCNRNFVIALAGFSSTAAAVVVSAI